MVPFGGEILKIFIYLVLAFASALNSVAIAALWRWFVVPLGVPSIGILQAMGLLLLFTVACSGGLGLGETASEMMRKGSDYVFEKIGSAISLPIAAILVGWFIALASTW